MSRSVVAAALLVALAALAAPGSARAESSRRGAALFSFCSQCHGEAGGGNPAALAPAIAGQQQWYLEAQLKKFRGGLRGKHPADTGGLRMYPMSLWLESDDDVQAVAAYVAGLPPAAPAPQLEGGDASRGKQLYAPCVACHGVDGTGNQAMNSPALVRTSDWYLLSSLQKFKGGIRGANPADPTGAIMRAMAGTLPDEQAMRDVVAHISTLSR